MLINYIYYSADLSLSLSHKKSTLANSQLAHERKKSVYTPTVNNAYLAVDMLTIVLGEFAKIF